MYVDVYRVPRATLLARLTIPRCWVPHRRWRPKANAADLCTLLSEGDIILFAGTRSVRFVYRVTTNLLYSTLWVGTIGFELRLNSM